VSLRRWRRCLFVLRRRGEGGDGAWRCGLSVAARRFLLVLLGIAGQVLARQTRIAVAGLVIVAAGVPVYAAMRRARPRTRD